MEWYLRLADGQAWVFEAGPGMSPWLEEMASIMKLKRDGSAEASRIRIIGGGAEKVTLAQPGCTGNEDSSGTVDLEDRKLLDLGLIRFRHHEKRHDIVCEVAPIEAEPQRYTQMRLFISAIYHQAVDLGGVPLHAALLEREGVGVVLAAPGNTGKSTCCKRIPSPWRAVCDDETLVVSLGGNRYAAHPFPTWSEYMGRRSRPTWDLATEIPLKAIFCLEQGEADEAIPMGQGKTAVHLAGLAREEVLPPWMKLDPPDEVKIRKRLFENACRLASSVPAYRLRAWLDGEFWKEMDRVFESLSPIP